MKTKLKDVAKHNIDNLLGTVGLQRTHRGAYVDFRDYIPFKETIEGAREAGLSVGDYIDLTHNRPGVTQETIDQMAALGVFSSPIERVCEIGPGSGRYLEKTIKVCHPSYYEVYETAREWREWLVETYKVVSHPADGQSLSSTPTSSIDLVQAHKVFPGLPILILCRYFMEMARVIRPGGKIVFDIMSEACFDDPTLEQWLASGLGYDTYPNFMSKQFAVDFFQKLGFSLTGSFFAVNKPGKVEYLVFTKNPA